MFLAISLTLFLFVTQGQDSMYLRQKAIRIENQDSLGDDKDLNIANKVLSINHCYAKGEVWDNSGDSLQLYQVDNTNSNFAKTVGYENYLFLYPHDAKMKYSGIYFTRKVTPSNLVSKR